MFFYTSGFKEGPPNGDYLTKLDHMLSQQDKLDHRANWTKNLYFTGVRKGDRQLLRSWVQKEREARLHAQELYTSYPVWFVSLYKKYRYYWCAYKRFTEPVRVRWCGYHAERAYRLMQQPSSKGSVAKWYAAETKVLRAQGVVYSRASFVGKPSTSSMELTMAHFLRQRRLGMLQSGEVDSSL